MFEIDATTFSQLLMRWMDPTNVMMDDRDKEVRVNADAL